MHFVPTGKGVDDNQEWECVDCHKKDTMENLNKADCPEGASFYYPADYPEKVILAERDKGTHLERYVVMRMEYYDQDVEFERAMGLKDRPFAEVMLRLGALKSGMWTAISKLDGGDIDRLDGEIFKAVMEHGIAPQRRSPDHSSCCFGFSESEQKWYGWSHRAFCGFAIGFVAEEDTCGCAFQEAASGSLTARVNPEDANPDPTVPVGFECKTLDDCKRMAIAFAADIS
jgi:hypothetical protein